MPAASNNKKGGKKKVHHTMGSTNIAAFNATKKQFPQLNKTSATTGSTTT